MRADELYDLLQELKRPSPCYRSPKPTPPAVPAPSPEAVLLQLAREARIRENGRRAAQIANANRKGAR